LCSLGTAFLGAGNELLPGALRVCRQLPGRPVASCCAQLGIGEIGVCSFRKSAVAKRREAELVAKPGRSNDAFDRGP
jgi:hypothetical protein